MTEAAAIETIESGLKGNVTIIEPDRAQRAVARRSAETRAIVPTVELTANVDMTTCLKRDAEVACGVLAFVIDAAAHALGAVPLVNGAYRDGRYEMYSRVNIGVTLVEAGVYVTPTIFNADQKGLDEISVELTDYRDRARAGELLPAELTGATFTVLDSTAYNVAVSPLIVPTQAAALSAGPITDTPVVRNGEIVPGRTLLLGLSVDHRIIYGHHAASFLEEIKGHLEESGQ
jgi:pyruvate dehydrogenase E2 component (dihydrolipoamide acetyltransferase)